MAMTQRYIGFAPWEEKDFLGQYLESKGKGFKALSRKEFKKLSDEDKSKLRLAIRYSLRVIQLPIQKTHG